MSAPAYALREIPLSSAPRQTRRVPSFEIISGTLFDGVFETVFGHVVNLHSNGTYKRAAQIYSANIPLYLERDYDNDHDANAVTAHVDTAQGREWIGYVDSDTAATIAHDMDKGAELIAYCNDRPRSGSGTRGGQLEIMIKLA